MNTKNAFREQLSDISIIGREKKKSVFFDYSFFPLFA